jgi:4-aminobutyrate--pyruvate transaminase
VANKSTRQKFDPAGSAGAFLFAKAHERGLILRPIEDTLAFCPPLIITRSEVAQMLSIFSDALDDTWAWVQQK